MASTKRLLYEIQYMAHLMEDDYGRDPYTISTIARELKVDLDTVRSALHTNTMPMPGTIGSAKLVFPKD